MIYWNPGQTRQARFCWAVTDGLREAARLQGLGRTLEGFQMNADGRACVFARGLRPGLLGALLCAALLAWASPSPATENVFTVFIAAGSGGTPGAIQGQGSEAWAATRTTSTVSDDPATKDTVDGVISPPVVAPVALAEWYRPWSNDGSYGFFIRDARQPLASSPLLSKVWDDLIVWADNGSSQYTSDFIHLFISGAGVPNTVAGQPVVYKLVLTHAPASYTGPTEWTLPAYPYPDDPSKRPWYQIVLPSEGAITREPIEGTGPLAATQTAGYRFSFVAQAFPGSIATVVTAGPANGSLSNSRSATFTFQGFGPLNPLGYLRYQVRLDGGGWSEPSEERSVTFNNLGDGQHTFSVRVVDGADNPDPAPPVVVWTVDATPPELSILAGPTEGEHLQSGDVTFTFSAQDNLTAPSGLVFRYLLDSGTWVEAGAERSVQYSSLSAGFHQFTVRVDDAAGNTAIQQRKFYVDLLPPTVSITEGPLDGGLSRPDGTFVYTGTDDVTAVELLRYQTKLDDAEWSDASLETTFEYQDLANGEHTFSVRSVDLSGRLSLEPVEVRWTVSDGTDIVTAIITGPEDGAYIATNSAAFTYTGLGLTPLTYQTMLDGAGWTQASTATAINYTNLADGMHTFSVRTVDGLGAVDETPATRTFWVDTLSPSLTVTSGPANLSWVNSASVTFTVTGSDNLTPPDQLRVEGQVGAGAWKAGDSATSYTFTDLTQGLRQLNLRSVDLAGNTSNATQRSVNVDFTPPVAVVTTTDLYLPATGTISYTGADNMAPKANLRFQTRMDDGPWSDWIAATPYTYGVLPEGQHRFEVRARDLAGNIGNAQGYDFRVDTTPPSTFISTGPDEGSHSRDQRATFTFTATDNMSVGDNIRYDVRLDAGSWIRMAIGIRTYTTPTLSEGPHTFSVRATDSVGNADPNPPVRTWYVDRTAPSVTILSGPAHGSFDVSVSGAFTFTGADNITTTTSLRYRTKLDGAPWSAPAADTSFAYSALEAGPHTFSVVAVDLAGNETATPQTRAWTIDPAAPSGLTVTDDGEVTTETTKLHASWSATAGASGIAEFQYAIGTEPADPGGGYLVGWSSAAAATDVTRAALGLQIGTTYYFYVRARSGAGIWSDVAVSDGIRVESPPFETVGQTKRLPNSLTGTLKGVIVVAGPSSFYEGIYVEAPDRSAGLKVLTGEPVQEGDIVEVTGKLVTSLTGEKAIQATSVKVTGQTVPLEPLSMKLLSAAGRNADFNAATGAGQRGVTDPPAWGTNCSGMLVKVAGWVGEVDFATATIKVNDGSWPELLGARVDGVTAISGVHLNSLVTVTGVVGMRRAGLQYQLVIHTRKSEDLQIELLDPPLEMIRRLKWLGMD